MPIGWITESRMDAPLVDMHKKQYFLTGLLVTSLSHSPLILAYMTWTWYVHHRLMC